MKEKIPTKTDKLFFKHRIQHPVIIFIAETIFVVVSFALGILPITNLNLSKNFMIALTILWFLALIFRIIIFVRNRLTMREFNHTKVSQELSAATLKAQQLANESKTRSILQLTYGHVPEWHPVDFYKNLLIYDVHEQLRAILIEMKKSICLFSNIDHDAVTIDLVYCYPDEKYDGTLPTRQDTRNAWRIITGGDSSCNNYQLHDFLSSSESFYFHLDQNNFAFFNNKQAATRYYLPSGKDQEYGKDGSIVGITINIKNDQPERVLIKAMLSIITHGRKLCEKDSKIKEEDYIDIFKKQVLNGFKSLLESELIQMYIRHVVRNDKMCIYTGIMKATDTCEQRQEKSSPICPFKIPCGKCLKKLQRKHESSLCIFDNNQ